MGCGGSYLRFIDHQSCTTFHLKKWKSDLMRYKPRGIFVMFLHITHELFKKLWMGCEVSWKNSSQHVDEQFYLTKMTFCLPITPYTITRNAYQHWMGCGGKTLSSKCPTPHTRKILSCVRVCHLKLSVRMKNLKDNFQKFKIENQNFQTEFFSIFFCRSRPSGVAVLG